MSSRTRTAGNEAPARVPDPTAGFWVAKAASTAFGEAASDFSIRVMPPVLAVLLGFALFALALGWQLTRRRYVPGVYWFFGGTPRELVDSGEPVPTNHSPHFAPVIEPTLSTGVRAAYEVILSRLRRQS